MTAPEGRPEPPGEGRSGDTSGAEVSPAALLERHILGATPTLTSEDVAHASGFSSEEIRQLWRALGFPDAGLQHAFTDADIGALSVLAGLRGSGALDRDTVLRMTRAAGQTIARLAEWEVGTMVSRVEALEAGPGATGSRLGSAERLLTEVGPAFEELLIYTWRRHLHAAVLRVEALGAADHDLHTTELTIGFADLVGFSAYSNELSQEQIGELVEDFESRCLDAVAGRRGRVIKTLGDSVLYVSETADEGYEVAEEILRQIRDARSLPDVRIGLATGPVVLRMGDVFGPAVNLAARMTAVARRNRVIVDRRTAGLLPPETFSTRELPARPIRGFGEVAPIAVRRRPRPAQTA